MAQNPDIKKIVRGFLSDSKMTTNTINAIVNKRFSLGDLKELDEKQLIDELREQLEGKRYRPSMHSSLISVLCLGI